MATLEDQINGLLRTVSDENWTRITKYGLESGYEDDDGYIEVEGRNIGDLTNEVSVEGEDRSQYIAFIMPRFYDGIDLVDMTINVHYELPDGRGSNDYIVNAYYSDEHIKFGWVIPQAAVQENTTISICIFAVGSVNNKQYIFKTLTKQYRVNPGLDINAGIIEPDDNWYVEFILRLERTTEELIQQAYEFIDEHASQYLNIDTELSISSGNVVQNKVVTNAINGKQDAITIGQDGYLVI